MRIRELNHSVYQVMYHIVWGTKYRRKILKPYTQVELTKSMYKVIRKYPDWYIQELNTDQDHVHLLIEIPPKYSVSKVVQILKSTTGGYLRKKYPYIDHIYSKSESVWATGYFVSTVGLNEETIRRYIERQRENDVGTDITHVFETPEKETPDN